MTSFFSKILLFLILFKAIEGFSQKSTYTISGYLSDANTGEKLIGANIFDTKTLQGTSTNVYGFYSLTLPADTYQIMFSYVGYQNKAESIILDKNMNKNIGIFASIELKEVEINAEKSEQIHQKTQMGAVSIPIQQIEKLPTFLGERDLVKVVQMLPGVQNQEGSSGMYVRGGGPDQNLILLDGVPVYNVNHLLGFFSVFNSDAISHVELTKAGFPARYGGRLSSVLDIRMKEGNNQKITGSASIGLISSKLTLEGPIVKDKTSFIFSGRRTYLDILAKPIIKAISKEQTGSAINAGYYFYDLNAKINHTFNDKNRLFLSAYTGKDKAYIVDEAKYSDYKYKEAAKLFWGNLTTALRWNYIVNPKLFANTTLTYSRYGFVTGFSDQNEYTNQGVTIKDFSSFEYNSGIYDVGGKIDFDYLPSPNHYVRFGINHIYHTFSPGISTLKYQDANEDTTVSAGQEDIYSHESSVYIEDEMKLGALLKVNLGLHGSLFQVNGKSYFNFQPRVSLNYLLSEKTSLKASYSRMAQYIHLLTNATVGLPTDLWVPVTDSIKPMLGDQYSLGIAHTLNKTYEISLEGYYKDMQNIIEYKDGVSFLTDGTDWQKKVEMGKGWAYGAELFVQKKTGKLTGWVGYSLSWTNRQFTNINFGEVFPYKYDRRHDISIALLYDFSEKFNMGLTWEYGTGNAITLPVSTYPIASGINNTMNDPYNYYYNPTVNYYQEKNSYRTPAYHRMDISFNFVKKLSWAERTWNISIFNLYNRLNPFYIAFEEDYEDYTGNGTLTKKLFQYSLFPIIPSFSYNLKF